MTGVLAKAKPLQGLMKLDMRSQLLTKPYRGSAKDPTNSQPLHILKQPLEPKFTSHPQTTGLPTKVSFSKSSKENIKPQKVFVP